MSNHLSTFFVLPVHTPYFYRTSGIQTCAP